MAQRESKSLSVATQAINSLDIDLLTKGTTPDANALLSSYSYCSDRARI
jgi:hypothetical protein